MAAILIKSLEIEDLFGYFTYNIKTETEEENKFLILYGDNGSGKTTILKSIFYLISSQDKSGHKSELANIIFKKFIVHLSNGISIGAVRNKTSAGSFEYIISEDGKIKYSIFLKARERDPEYFIISVRDDDKDNMKLLEIYDFISTLKIKIFFLSDKRQIMDAGSSDIRNNPIFQNSELIADSLESKRLLRELEKHHLEDPINTTVRNLENWIRSKAFKASRVGERNTTKLYDAIVKQIISTDTKGDENINVKVQDIQKLIKNVYDRTKLYAELGLINRSEYTELEKSFNNVTNDKKIIVYNIIEPYIKGIEARLDALENLHTLLSAFIEQMNSFLSYKKISYSLQSGFRINQIYTNERIPFDKLSSGEKQLILIICSTILASNQATIFIIDEPEISLNVKWQRKLLDTLLKFGRTGGVHFIIATHSIELLSNNRFVVKRLINEKELK